MQLRRRRRRPGKGMLWPAGGRNIRGIPYTDAGCRHGLKANNDILMLFCVYYAAIFLGTNTNRDGKTVEDVVLITEYSWCSGEDGGRENGSNAARAGIPRQTKAKIYKYDDISNLTARRCVLFIVYCC